jgi:uncharacterized NAD(P)/FAD-binding protein YdhS
MPPESEQIIRELISRGQLRLVAGRISQACSHPAGIRCTVANRKGTELETIHAQRVINCTGPESDPLRWKSPLVQGLLSRGTMRLHPNGLGLDATPAGALIDAQGKVSDRLYAIGPLLKAVLFESVAVPEIRLQAQTLAKMLLTQKALQAGSSPGVRDKSRPAP